MRIIDHPQGSDAWLKARVGLVTASRVADVAATTKSGPSASRATYMGELIVERLTGAPAEKFTNAAMQWGTDKEPEARAAYEMATETWVKEVGLVLHPSIDLSAASPDGLVGDAGLVELKCPVSATHIETLLGQKVPAKYITQMQWQMACCERAWCDFVSFDPRMPDEMQLFIRRVERDDVEIARLEGLVTEFLFELGAKLHALKAAYQRAA